MNSAYNHRELVGIIYKNYKERENKNGAECNANPGRVSMVMNILEGYFLADFAAQPNSPSIIQGVI